MLTASQHSFQSLITYHQKRHFHVLPFFFFVFVLNGGREKDRGEKRKKRKGHEWWMLFVCLSFPITELCLLKRRCISHFCLSDWWRAGSDWGHCVLNTASLVFQHLLQLQYATLLAPALQCTLSSFVTLMFSYHMNSFSILWYVKK